MYCGLIRIHYMKWYLVSWCRVMTKFIDVKTFYCGNCKKYDTCNRPYPSTGKRVAKDDVACMDSFELCDSPKMLEELSK